MAGDMDWLGDNWGSLVSSVGLVIAVTGIGLAVYRAGQAEKAAKAAENASTEARNTITRVLTIVDLQKAIDLIQRVKLLHRDGKWEASLEHYQTVRSMLADIETRHPSPTEEFRTIIREAIPQFTVIEDNIDRAIQEGEVPFEATRINLVLNQVQEYLEEAASTIFITEVQAGI